MTTKHTPGPWRDFIELMSGMVMVEDASGETIAIMSPVSDAEAEVANGALTAAAPEMLEALLHAQRNMPHPDQMIDDAIAKATGDER